MNNTDWKAWGKLTRNEENPVVVHTLVDHSIDVAFVLKELLLLSGVQKACAAAARTLGEVDRQRLAALAFLHDVGKANVGFQVRYWSHEREKPRPWQRLRTCGHGPQGWALFEGSSYAARRVVEGLPLAQLDTWGESVLALLHASISHHGRPVVADHTVHIWQPVTDGNHLIYDPAAAVAELGGRVQALFPQAFSAAGKELPGTPQFVHLFAGLVQLADWLGSDTRPRFFPYSEPGEDRARTAPERARHALQAIGLDWGDVRARPRSTSVDFSTVFGVASARPMQAAMAGDDLGPVVVLEAETGSGKTEAALWRFLHLWRAGAVDGLYFALPTRVAATQLYERVRTFAGKAWLEHVPIVVRALPGYAAADGQAPERLPGFQVLWHDEPSDREAERRWAAEMPKRYLAAPIAVGTIDQALLGVLQIRHAHLRHATLTRSLLVIDEVHASDAYMTRLTEHLLRTHVACGGHALLLSATLGAVARTRYLSIIASDVGAEVLPSLATAQSLPYPAIGTRHAGRACLRAVDGNPQSKTVHWQAIDCIDDPPRVAELAVDAAARGARVLVIRNTVNAAVATLHAVEKLALERRVDCLFNVAGASTLHHSRFSRQDRPLLDAAVEAQIGKVRSTTGGRVIVGTQTLEQSLDIDADLLITDLCPMDVLLQRLGRLHRHPRPSAGAPHDQRPTGFEQARAWILTPSGGDLMPLLQRQHNGLGPIRRRGEPMAGVYIDLRVLEATRRLIANAPTREIPADNRELVERSTHPEALDAIAGEMGPEWETFGQEYDGKIQAMSTMANIHAIAFDQEFGLYTVAPESEAAVGSRLGAADSLVVFADPLPRGPFGQEVQQLALRHHLLPPELPADAQAQGVQPLEGEPGFRFSLGAACYRYSRFGIERLKEEG